MADQQGILADHPERQHNGKPLCAGAVALVLAGLGAPAAALEHHYTVAVAPGLDSLDIRAEFGAPVTRVRARSSRAGDVLASARQCDGGAPLEARGRRLLLSGRPVNCIEYSVDLAAAAAADRQRHGFTGEAVVASPARWLWRPRVAAGDRIVVRFELPPGFRVAVPWQPQSGQRDTFVLTRSPESGRAPAVFGRFPAATRTVAGTELRVTVLGPLAAARTAELADWVGATAGNVALAYGRFPNPAVSVFLVPVTSHPWGGDSSAVPFGRVVRDGGEAIELLVDPERPTHEFYAEWTPTHEFAHLMLPYLDGHGRWISEGFATYYQNVLLARAGQYSEARAWAKLVTGFERGRQSVPWLSPNAAAAGSERNTRMKVYWSGAALALIADVELRRRSGGTESLDTVLGALAGCCLPSDRTWTGPELFRTLDALLDAPLFVPLYRRHADSAGFPDVEALLDALGVTTGGDVELTGEAPLSAIRQQLMQPPAGP